jgi:hypothetical protein
MSGSTVRSLLDRSFIDPVVRPAGVLIQRLTQTSKPEILASLTGC